MNGFDLVPRGFYLRIYTNLSDNRKFRHIDGGDAFLHRDCVCVLADDEDDYYWFCGELADGSIVVADEKGELLPRRGKRKNGMHRPRTSKVARRGF